MKVGCLIDPKVLPAPNEDQADNEKILYINNLQGSWIVYGR